MDDKEFRIQQLESENQRLADNIKKLNELMLMSAQQAYKQSQLTLDLTREVVVLKARFELLDELEAMGDQPDN